MQEKEEARNDLLTAIHPHIETFFKLANEFIELPVSYATFFFLVCVSTIIINNHNRKIYQ